MGQPILDLFASRLCHQRPWYIALKPDLGSIAIYMFLDPLNREYDFAFPPCSLISRVLTKIFKEKTDHRIIVTPTWQTQPWYAQILKMSIHPPVLLPLVKNLLTNSQRKIHLLVEVRSLRIAMWKFPQKFANGRNFNLISHSGTKSLTTNYKL